MMGAWRDTIQCVFDADIPCIKTFSEIVLNHLLLQRIH